MDQITIPIGDVVSRLVELGPSVGTCLLDCCGVRYQDSRLMIAGVNPVKRLRLAGDDTLQTLAEFDRLLGGDLAAVFTISYDFGTKLSGLGRHPSARPALDEPDIYVALFDSLIVHDYVDNRTRIVGNAARFDEIEKLLGETYPDSADDRSSALRARSNVTKRDYLDAIAAIKEHIRSGDTYQVNLTQQIVTELGGLTPGCIFKRLRRDHPAAYSAYIDRGDSTVVSVSPERFFKAANGKIEASPVKGTRPRGTTSHDDDRLRTELLTSEKDRAENTMIVDLLRNDLGRICEYGTITVDRLCEIEEHPTLFHLVSAISGRLRDEIRPSDIIRALFPCGSITGAPKLSTMRIIDPIEPTPRGLSMGAIGVYIPDGFDILPRLEMSVAIRTMTVRDDLGCFNVGGGIVIDSDAEAEYDESLIKARAMLQALGLSADDLKSV